MVINEAEPEREDRDLACLTRGLAAGHQLRVPKILAFLIPEILSDLVLAGRNSSLLPPQLGKRGGRREEDARNAETPRNRNLAQGWAPEDGSGPFGWGVGPIRPSHRGRESGGSCQRLCGAHAAAHWETQYRGRFPEIRP